MALEIRIFASSITEAALMDRDEYRLSLQPWMSRCALVLPTRVESTAGALRHRRLETEPMMSP